MHVCRSVVSVSMGVRVNSESHQGYSVSSTVEVAKMASMDNSLIFQNHTRNYTYNYSV